MIGCAPSKNWKELLPLIPAVKPSLPPTGPAAWRSHLVPSCPFLDQTGSGNGRRGGPEAFVMLRSSSPAVSRAIAVSQRAQSSLRPCHPFRPCQQRQQAPCWSQMTHPLPGGRHARLWTQQSSAPTTPTATPSDYVALYLRGHGSAMSSPRRKPQSPLSFQSLYTTCSKSNTRKGPQSPHPGSTPAASRETPSLNEKTNHHNSPASGADVSSAEASSSPLAHENIYNIPNILTFSRLLLTPVIGYLVVEGSHPGIALSLFCYAGVTDLADGWIARRWKLRTVVGSVIDPMADKALMTVLTAALAAKGALPVWLAVIILGRDVGLAISAIYYRWISLPPPKTFARYWDFSLPSAEVRPTTISKYNTFLQLGLVGLTTAQPIIEPWTGVGLGGFLGIFQYVVAVTTVWSGASYVFSKDAVRILSQKSKSKRD
ncbi:hypothetical protein MKZ38_008045 [Zalerion maritima]|uniref:Cardiolipin synthase n=1 Tax=Zalerion maritima TaxID=339359 RepID=A0AAD5RHK3_9PEZI|nr:hypothetical protein MKZ38_008045 [Zalerion maritima]